jgi:hypothetical protein
MKKSLVVALSAGAISASILLYRQKNKAAVRNPLKSEKVGVNKRFFAQLKFLLRICIPTCNS